MSYGPPYEYPIEADIDGEYLIDNIVSKIAASSLISSSIVLSEYRRLRPLSPVPTSRLLGFLERSARYRGFYVEVDPPSL